MRRETPFLEIYQEDDLGIQHKSDETPVTKADLAANAVIEKGLSALPAQYPILSEESTHTALKERSQWQRYWLVDPLDGTQEFINRNGQFSVNIALMEKSSDGRSYPLFGMVHIPVTNTTYWGGKGFGAFKQIANEPVEAIQPRRLQSDSEVVVLCSRSYKTQRAADFGEQLKIIYPTMEFKAVGSALKSCHIAEGIADIYPRLGPTSEWDTGAVQGVVEGAGGLLLDPAGERFSYNFKESLLNSDFLVIGDPSHHWQAYWNQDALDRV